MKENWFEAISSIKELNDEDAATCSGGVAYTGSGDPDVILYRDVQFAGSNPLRVNASPGDGLRYVGNDFNDLTSSLVIIRGTWAFYRDANFTTYQTTLGPGIYSIPPSGIANDSLSSLYRVS
ncbi:beta/gamma crystallin-related protein [Nostoc sp. ChiQUE01b]|uniref:beta/gamma crystallin-related protein n=1 Tax=Nostoc sp. ChiQUE01b TaxID=3075376 RepID=UPI002AD4708B|nr:beta/gamma crystallin-related protein [Nostoc sp. ChiQUE01b]MDZ8263329.1 beta/gamma crystallin-related protein [Nostoc sp. ChiQUE01b]